MGLTDSLTYHQFHLGRMEAALRASPTGSVIAVAWHQDLFLLVGSLRGRAQVAALASRSGDGAIIAEHLIRRGIRVVRGSSHRGAAPAAKELIQAVGEGWTLAIAIDGPRGPFRVPKGGPLEIARAAGVPIVPVAARATRELRIPSWDRFRLPLPRAHVALVYGEPIVYPSSEPDAATLIARRQHLAQQLHQLDAEATRRCGRADEYPPAQRIRWPET